jgi:hypothetical protein
MDLELALADLAEHLDHPPADDLAAAVRLRVVNGATAGHDRARSLLAVAAVFVLIVAAALAIPPTRHAIADWLGIGAIEVRRPDPTLGNRPGAHPVPGSPGATGGPDAGVVARLAAARRAVDFAIVTPSATPNGVSIGALRSVEVDRRAPGGLVALGYPRFTLVEVSANAGDPGPVAKLVEPGTADRVLVGDRPGLWISGVHRVTFLARDGTIRVDSVRRAGSVLIWERGGVTFRVEGFDDLADAQRVAAALV